ncbi:hypothetical protein GF362_05585 [Candidatus Dojkabacteria bacterium]|nr:hypothetical protein [Candidatus Dojkabacteria bacterium]
MQYTETFVVSVRNGEVQKARGLCTQCPLLSTCGSNIFETRIKANGNGRPVYHFDVTGNYTGSDDCLFQQRYNVWGHCV